MSREHVIDSRVGRILETTRVILVHLEEEHLTRLLSGMDGVLNVAADLDDD